MGELRIKMGCPQPKQIELLTSTAKYFCYGGARAGGKSWIIDFAAKLYCLKYPGIKIMIVRRSYPELNENHIIPLRSATEGVCTYRDREKSLIFPGGSRIKFSYCANEGDELQYNGQEWDIIMLDEAQQLTESAFNAIKATLRGVNGFPKRMFICCNPGGVGMLWIRRLFIERDFNENENPEDHAFIQALVTDNEALMKADPDYIKQLESLPPNMRAAWRYGDWYSFEGRFFSELKGEIHTVEPFAIPSHWRRYRSIDYGLDMTAVLWVAVSETGEEYVYRELHESDLIVSEAAKRICELSDGEEIYETYAPPDLWHRSQDSGRNIAELFAENGVVLRKCNSERQGGWQSVKEHMKPIPSYDGTTTSRLRIFKSCRVLIKHMSLLEYDSKNPCDAAREPHIYTHICDSLRYFCAMKTTPPKGRRGERSEAQRLAEMKKRSIGRMKRRRR